jgi:hypothetical protein
LWCRDALDSLDVLHALLSKGLDIFGWLEARMQSESLEALAITTDSSVQRSRLRGGEPSVVPPATPGLLETWSHSQLPQHKRTSAPMGHRGHRTDLHVY